MTIVILLLFLLIELFIFHNWFSIDTLASGDWLYKFPLSLSQVPLIPSVWDSQFANGLGGNMSFLLALNSYYIDTAYFITSFLHIPWEIYERTFWYFPFIVIAFFSTRLLFKHLFPDKNEFFSSFAGLLYTTNTFILMIVGGGQIAIGIAYALIPLVIYTFLKLIIRTDGQSKVKEMLRFALIAALVFSVELLFDLRYAYITLCAVFILILLMYERGRFWKTFLFAFIIPLCITGLLHAFWLIPFVIHGQNPIEQLGNNYSSVDALNYFSFAKLEDTIGLLHPYWPENIFGKVSFMKPEFLLFPILAFSSLFFITQKKKKESKYIIYFATLGLIGAFLAKGSTDPFGIIYVELFNHFPGFSMFRDPLKWYTFIALSYSILIPYTLAGIFLFFKIHKRFVQYKLHYIISIAILVFFFLTLRPILMNQLNGTFKPQMVPREYVHLEEFLGNQPDYFRTFWIPSPSNLAFSSYNHPLIASSDYLKDFDQYSLLQKLNRPSTKQVLQEASIKYIIVPDATRGELFLKDRKYDEKLYQDTISSVSALPWLKPIPGFGRIAIFELTQYKEHLYIANDSQAKTSVSMQTPTLYTFTINNGKTGDLIMFTEAFDRGWKLYLPNGSSVDSVVYGNKFNSFRLTEGGNYQAELIYDPQKWVIPGIIISVFTLAVTLFGVLYLKQK